jgi:hypothetical protein
MKPAPTSFKLVLACALIFILAGIGLPNASVRAAPPAPTSEPTKPINAGCDSSRTIQVSGSAVVNVKPDRALIQLGVQSNGRSAKEAQARNSATIIEVTKALKALGIDSKDVSTEWYVIEPLYEDYDSLSIKGYRINNVISITMRDVQKTSDAIAAAFQAGANQVVNVDFYTTELRKYRDQARELAMKAAAEKAQALARTAGADTGCVLTINENTSSYFNGWSWWQGYGNNQSQMTQNAVQNVAPTGAGEAPSLDDGPVSAGMISVRADVSASFGLK